MTHLTDKARAIFKNYSFPVLLIISISIGAVLGLALGERSGYLKPLGDIFLNLLFTAVVPLVFFSISSAVAGISNMRTLRKILLWMIVIFISTAILSSLLMFFAVTLFPPDISQVTTLTVETEPVQPEIQSGIISLFTVPDFSALLSASNILALIVFSLLVGLAAASIGEKAAGVAAFLASGNAVMMKLISFIMLYAPIGLGAYFAYFTGFYGPQLLGGYLGAVAVYYPVAICYFFAANTFYTYLAGGAKAVRAFWTFIPTPALTALATGSSIATVPSNLQAAKSIGVPPETRNIIIPIGATIHMDGTCLSAILKIAVLFSIFEMPFTGAGTIALAIGIAILSGMVMSGIPGGGFLGELLIVTLYGFPPEALPLIALLGILIDPPATMVNATGDNAASMLAARLVRGKNWMEKRQKETARFHGPSLTL